MSSVVGRNLNYAPYDNPCISNEAKKTPENFKILLRLSVYLGLVLGADTPPPLPDHLLGQFLR